MQVLQLALDGGLRLAVRIRGRDRRAFRDGRIRLAVNGRRRAEYHPLDARPRHRCAQGAGTEHVVIVVPIRMRNGFGDGLQAGEVHDRDQLMLAEYPLQGSRVAQVGMVEDREVAGYARDAIQNDRVAVTQVVYDDRLVSSLDERDARMRPDVTGAAGEQDLGQKAGRRCRYSSLPHGLRSEDQPCGRAQPDEAEVEPQVAGPERDAQPDQPGRAVPDEQRRDDEERRAGTDVERDEVVAAALAQRLVGKQVYARKAPVDQLVEVDR